MTKVWIGIDPGKTGAIAIVGQDNTAAVHDWPGDEVGAADIVRGIISRYKIVSAALEKVHAYPKQGSVSTFNLGANMGQWQGILAAFGIPYAMVDPRVWQSGVVPKKTNERDKPSLAVARRLFPTQELHLKKHDGRADALLIAKWCQRTHGGG